MSQPSRRPAKRRYSNTQTLVPSIPGTGVTHPSHPVSNISLQTSTDTHHHQGATAAGVAATAGAANTRTLNQSLTADNSCVLAVKDMTGLSIESILIIANRMQREGKAITSESLFIECETTSQQILVITSSRSSHTRTYPTSHYSNSSSETYAYSSVGLPSLQYPNHFHDDDFNSLPVTATSGRSNMRQTDSSNGSRDNLANSPKHMAKISASVISGYAPSTQQGRSRNSGNTQQGSGYRPGQSANSDTYSDGEDIDSSGEDEVDGHHSMDNVPQHTPSSMPRSSALSRPPSSTSDMPEAAVLTTSSPYTQSASRSNVSTLQTVGSSVGQNKPSSSSYSGPSTTASGFHGNSSSGAQGRYDDVDCPSRSANSSISRGASASTSAATTSQPTGAASDGLTDGHKSDSDVEFDGATGYWPFVKQTSSLDINDTRSKDSDGYSSQVSSDVDECAARFQLLLQSVQRENEILKAGRKCVSCHDKCRDITFLPCGHFITCRTCAGPIYTCMQCHRSILATVDTYLS